MRAALLPAMALWQAGTGRESPVRHLRVVRAVQVPPGSGGPACAVLDADVYAHAQGESLNDLRLFATGSVAETPFALTESKTERTESEPAEIRNVSTQGQAIGFDLEMPKRPYTAVELELRAKNFVGAATVSARDGAGHAVALGEFAIFDLSARHLPRSTTLALQESTFAELHVVLHLHAAPGALEQTFAGAVVQGASVPPSRAAQTMYTAVAGSNRWTQRGQESVATVHLPAHAPVERVRVQLDPGYQGSFLRGVTIAARPDQQEAGGAGESDVETVSGEISQVRLGMAQGVSEAATLPGGPIDYRHLAVDAVLAANLRGGATVQMAVANGGERPLPLRSVQLEMRERRICFEASPGAGEYTLMYGDEQLPAPVYDYGRGFAAGATPLQATLGPERANPEFVPRANVRPFAERHPDLLWLGLLAALAAGGGVMMRGVRHRRGGWR